MPIEDLKSKAGRKIHQMVIRHETGEGRRDPLLKIILFFIAIKIAVACFLSSVGDDSGKYMIS